MEGDGEVAGPQAYRKMGLISSMLRIKKTAVQCLVRLAWWWFWYSVSAVGVGDSYHIQERFGGRPVGSHRSLGRK